MNISKEHMCLYTPVCSSRASAFEIIEHAAELGVGGVELMNFCDELRQPDRAVAQTIAKAARSHGLKLPCFSAYADIYANTALEIERLSRYAEICSDLEIPYLHHTVAPDLNWHHMTESEREHRFLTCMDAVLELCEYANTLGVRTLIEDQGFVFNGARNCLRLCDLSDERIGIVADVGNILFFDEKPEDFIRAVGSHICHVHIKDYMLSETPFADRKCHATRLSNYLCDAEIGTGKIDFQAVQRAFSDISYNGMYSLEFVPGCDKAEVKRVLHRLTVR